MKRKNDEIPNDIKHAIQDEKWRLARRIAKRVEDKSERRRLLRIINYEKRTDTEITVTLTVLLYSNQIDARIAKIIRRQAVHGYEFVSRTDELPRRILSRNLDTLFPRIWIRLDFVRKRFTGLKYDSL